MECQDIHRMISGGVSVCKDKIKTAKSGRDDVFKGKT